MSESWTLLVAISDSTTWKLRMIHGCVCSSNSLVWQNPNWGPCKPTSAGQRIILRPISKLKWRRNGHVPRSRPMKGLHFVINWRAFIFSVWTKTFARHTKIWQSQRVLLVLRPGQMRLLLLLLNYLLIVNGDFLITFTKCCTKFWASEVHLIDSQNSLAPYLLVYPTSWACTVLCLWVVLSLAQKAN